MALILDKSITGITLADIDGNTLETGYTHITYEDECGNIHENPYLVIDNVIIDKLNYFVKISVNIYKDQNAREIFKEPVYLNNLSRQEQEVYEQYFSLDVMGNVNIFQAAYNFILNEYFYGWKSDEE